jgi:hypothetical protein
MTRREQRSANLAGIVVVLASLAGAVLLVLLTG